MKQFWSICLQKICTMCIYKIVKFKWPISIIIILSKIKSLRTDARCGNLGGNRKYLIISPIKHDVIAPVFFKVLPLSRVLKSPLLTRWPHFLMRHYSSWGVNDSFYVVITTLITWLYSLHVSAHCSQSRLGTSHHTQRWHIWKIHVQGPLSTDALGHLGSI